jgi:hypothetical protein
MYQTGTKIYQKDGSSFFSWNRRVSTTSSKASLSELKSSNKNGLGIKTIQVIDSSMRTKLIGSYEVGENSKNNNPNKSVEQNSIKTGLRFTRNLGSSVPKKCSARTTSSNKCC